MLITQCDGCGSTAAGFYIQFDQHTHCCGACSLLLTDINHQYTAEELKQLYQNENSRIHQTTQDQNQPGSVTGT